MSCTQNFNYPLGFQPSWFVGEGIDCIAAAYVAYYTEVYGTDVSSWPQGAQDSYGSYAPFALPSGYTLQSYIYVNDGIWSPNNVPIGYWATDDQGFINLVFRGTEGGVEWTQDAIITQSSNTITNNQGLPQGCVELGFQSEYNNFTTSLTDTYNDLVSQQYGENGLFIMGHSLGASLAELAANELSNATSSIIMYTIGCPRTGNPDFANTLDTLVPANYRITSAWDPIPDLPPVMIAPVSEQSVYQHTSWQCPVYTSETDFATQVFSDPLFGHHLSTYKTGLNNLINSGVIGNNDSVKISHQKASV